MKKEGFISMSIIYSFLIVFILLLLSMLAVYMQKSRLIDNMVRDIKISLEYVP